MTLLSYCILNLPLIALDGESGVEFLAGTFATDNVSDMKLCLVVSYDKDDPSLPLTLSFLSHAEMLGCIRLQGNQLEEVPQAKQNCRGSFCC